MSKLKTKAVDSVKWETIYSIITTTVNPLSFVILARLLSPIQFGYIAIVKIIISFSREIAHLGFSHVIIQKDDVSNEDLNSIFWFVQFIGISLGILIFILAGKLALIFNEGQNVANLIKYTSLIFLFEPLDLVFRTLLKKDLEYRFLSPAKLIRFLFERVSILILAYLGFGALSYIYGYLVGIAILTLIMFMIFFKKKEWMPKFYFNFSNLKPYLSKGMYIVGKSLLKNLTNYIDEIIVGGALGTESLGIYHFAKKIIIYLKRFVNKPISKVSFPLFSKLNSEMTQFNKAYTKIIKLIASIAIPAYIGIAVISSFIVPLFFGEKWLSAVPLISLLTIWGVFRVFYSGVIPGAMYSLEKFNWIFYMTGIDLIIRSIVLYTSNYFGIEIMIILLGIIEFLRFVIFQFVLNRLSGLDVREFFMGLKNISIASILMGISIVVLKLFISSILSNAFVLGIIIIFGIATYALFIYWFDKEFVYYVLNLVKQAI